jgi:hypothetical protein
MKIELKDVYEIEMIDFLEEIASRLLDYGDDCLNFNLLLSDFELPYYAFNNGDLKNITIAKK